MILSGRVGGGGWKNEFPLPIMAMRTPSEGLDGPHLIASPDHFSLAMRAEDKVLDQLFLATPRLGREVIDSFRKSDWNRRGKSFPMAVVLKLWALTHLCLSDILDIRYIHGRGSSQHEEL